MDGLKYSSEVIKLYEIFEEEKYICLVIELMEGGELFDLIEQ